MTEIVLKDKPFLATRLKITIVFVTTLLLLNLFNHIGWDFSFEKSNFGVWFATFLDSLIIVFVLFARDGSRIEKDAHILYKYVGLGHWSLFNEKIKLPAKANRILILKKKKRWRRYFALAIPFTTTLTTWDIFIVLTNGRPYRIFSLDRDEALRIGNSLAEFYSCTVDLKEPLMIEKKKKRKL